MEYIENSVAPAACIECDAKDCYECDHAGERWQLTELSKLLLKRKAKENAIKRLQQEIMQLDREIKTIKWSRQDLCAKLFAGSG